MIHYVRNDDLLRYDLSFSVAPIDLNPSRNKDLVLVDAGGVSGCSLQYPEALLNLAGIWWLHHGYYTYLASFRELF